MEPTKYDRVKAAMASRTTPSLPLGVAFASPVDSFRHVEVRMLTALSVADAEGECPWCARSAYVHRPDSRDAPPGSPDFGRPWRYVLCDGSIVAAPVRR